MTIPSTPPAWRTRANPLQQPTDHEVGDIAYLPPSEDVPATSIVRQHRDFQDRSYAFGHMAIIYQIDRSRETAFCFPVTSLGGQCADAKYALSPDERQRYLCLAQREEYCKGRLGMPVVRYSGHKLNKTSYVNVDGLFEVELATLMASFQAGEKRNVQGMSLEAVARYCRAWQYPAFPRWQSAGSSSVSAGEEE